MDYRSTRMFAEAAEAPSVVEAQLSANADLISRAAERLRRLAPSAALICGRGSSDNAGVYARYLIESHTGTVTSPAPLAISSVYGGVPHIEGGLCLAISQSGKSPDLVAATSAAKTGGAFVIALVNAEGSPLSAVADLTIPLRAGPELSVAATKSFIASLSAIGHLITEWTGDKGLREGLRALPDQLADAWRRDWRRALPILEGARNLYVVGRGVGYGVAREAALKLKETCGLHAEAFSAAEVRHGPMALVRSGFPVLALAQDDATLPDARDMAADFVARGARVMVASGAETPGAVSLPVGPAVPEFQPILMIQSFYRLAAELSVSRGFDPDHPPYLNKVTETV